MITLQQYINEKLIIKNDRTKLSYDTLLNMIAAADNDTISDVLNDIADSAAREPDIYDDSNEFNANDYVEKFGYTRDHQDDVYDIIIQYCSNNIVIGWCCEESFDELDKIIPSIFNDIKKSWMHRHIHNAMNNVIDIWRKFIGNTLCTLMKFNTRVKHNGTERKVYWYMFVIEMRN